MWINCKNPVYLKEETLIFGTSVNRSISRDISATFAIKNSSKLLEDNFVQDLKPSSTLTNKKTHGISKLIKCIIYHINGFLISDDVYNYLIITKGYYDCSLKNGLRWLHI